MKKYLPFLALAMAVSSCATSKNSVSEQNPASNKPANENTECTIEFKNGTIKKYSTLELVTGVLQAPHLLADGNQKIKPSEIKAYSSSKYYAVSQTEFFPEQKSYVAKEVLPGFAKRVVKGTINLYSLQMYNGHNLYEKFFLQQGDDGKITPYTPELLNEYVKENPAILNIINKQKKKPSSKQLVAAVKAYNSNVAINE